MEDFFLKNSKEMSNENLTMRKAALAAIPSGHVPCVAANGNKRVEIYGPREGKKRKLDPCSANAEELYRFYIRDLGFDETWIAPLDLDYQKSSGRFMGREKAKPKPAITEKSAYKGYLSCFKLHNYQQVMGIAGFEMIQQFKPQLEQALAKHGALKVYPSAYCLFERVLEGVAYQTDQEIAISLAPIQVLNAAQLDGALKQMVGAMQERIPEMELRGTGWNYSVSPRWSCRWRGSNRSRDPRSFHSPRRSRRRRPSSTCRTRTRSASSGRCCQRCFQHRIWRSAWVIT